MKKLLLLLIMLCVLCVGTVGFASAEEAPVTTGEITEEPPVATGEITEEPPVTTGEITEETPETEQTEEKSYEEIATDIAENILSQYLPEYQVQKIISLGIGGVVIVLGFALIIVYAKYRKYKHNNLVDVKNTVITETEKDLAEKLTIFSQEQIKPIIEQINNLVKIIALSQDNSANGKLALLEFISANNEAAKATSETIKESITETENTKKAVQEQVSGEYKDLF